MTALPNFEHAMQRAGYRVEYAQKLRGIGAVCGYILDYTATRKVRDWPEKSKKPWHIRYADGTLCASFPTLVAMENNLRGRCGC